MFPRSPWRCKVRNSTVHCKCNSDNRRIHFLNFGTEKSVEETFRNSGQEADELTDGTTVINYNRPGDLNRQNRHACALRSHTKEFCDLGIWHAFWCKLRLVHTRKGKKGLSFEDVICCKNTPTNPSVLYPHRLFCKNLQCPTHSLNCFENQAQAKHILVSSLRFPQLCSAQSTNLTSVRSALVVVLVHG